MEDTKQEKRTISLIPLCSDTKALGSLLPSPKKEEPTASSKDPEISVSRKRDKEVVQFAAPPASEVFGKWETHIARRTRNTFTAEEKRDIRLVAYQFGPDLFLRMSTDKEFMNKVHDRIDMDHFYKDMLTDRYRRKETISPLIHDMVKESESLLSEAKEKAMLNPDFDGKVSRADMDEVIKLTMTMAFLGAISLMNEGGFINA